MIAMIAEAPAAPPMPCTKRATISTPCEGASPQTAEASVKIAIPARNTRRRPIRSPSRPVSRSRLPKLIRYPLTTQVRLAWLKWRSRWIEGRATFTIDASTMFISCAKQTTTSAIQRERLSAEGAARDWIGGI